MWIRTGLLAVLAGVCADGAVAQRRELREAWLRYQQLPPVRLKGKVVQVGAGLIQVADDDGNPHMVGVDPTRTRIVVSGTATPSVLRPGMLVQFTTDLDAKQVAPEPLAELQIVGVGVELGIASDDPEGRGGPYRVAGNVKAYKEGRLTVMAGKKQVRARVAPDAAIKFEGVDYRLSKQGDEIDVQGRMIAQGQVLGEVVKVTLAQPLEVADSSPRGRRKTRRGEAEAPPAERAPAEEPAPRP